MCMLLWFVDRCGRSSRVRQGLHNVPAVCAYRILLCFRTQRTNPGFDAVLQFRDRVSSYIANGHPIDKIEILVLGGTWSEYPEGYQVRVVVASDSAVCPGCFFLFSGGRFLCGTFAAAAKLAMLCTRLF